MKPSWLPERQLAENHPPFSATSSRPGVRSLRAELVNHGLLDKVGIRVV
jgi:hypothetical protein